MEFTSEQRGPEDVYAASINQLKHMVLIFRTRYSCANVSILWHKALLYVIDDCLPKEVAISEKGKGVTQSEETQRGGGREDGGGVSADGGVRGGADDDYSPKFRQKIWLLACLAGYRALAPQFEIARSMFERLVSTAVLRMIITAEEARVLMDQIISDSNRSSPYPGGSQLGGRRTPGTMTLTSRGGPYEQNQPLRDAEARGSSNSNVFRTTEWPSQQDVRLEKLATSSSLITGFGFAL